VVKWTQEQVELPNVPVQLRAYMSKCTMEFARHKVSPPEKPHDLVALVCCNYR
jgi:hypothetical protein